LKDSITGNHLPYFNGRQKIDFHQKKEKGPETNDLTKHLYCKEN
jgi:hypothetical protein